MTGDGHVVKRRRREDDASTDIDSYVQDVIARLDCVILRLLAETHAIESTPPDEPERAHAPAFIPG